MPESSKFLPIKVLVDHNNNNNKSTTNNSNSNVVDLLCKSNTSCTCSTNRDITATVVFLGWLISTIDRNIIMMTKLHTLNKQNLYKEDKEIMQLLLIFKIATYFLLVEIIPISMPYKQSVMKNMKSPLIDGPLLQILTMRASGTVDVLCKTLSISLAG